LADNRNLPNLNEEEVTDGRIQNKNVIIELQNIFVIASFSEKSVDYERLQYYNLALEELNSYNNYTPLMTITNKKTDEFTEKFKNQILYFNEKTNNNQTAQNYLSRGIFQLLTNNYNQALADLDQAISRNEKSLLAYFSRANCRSKMIDVVESLTDYSEDMTIPVGTGNNNMTSVKESIVDYQYILNDYQKCINISPDFPFAWYNRAYIYCKLGRYDEAVGNYNKAIELQPDFAEAFFNRGLTKIYLDDVEGGANDLSKAGELGIEEAYNIIKRYCN